MEIYNTTRQVVLAEDVQVAVNFFDRLKGLLGRREFRVGEGLLLKPCRAVHSCFMLFPIDVVFLDDQMVVVHIIEGLPPFRLSPVIHKASSVLELPAGVTRLSGTRIGDRLSLRVSFH
ncbi:MAG: uncharacterized protein PWQ39_622 [Thermacetogenium sp.]|nr:uncharacterized protein [Thermacetogenium sp.]